MTTCVSIGIGGFSMIFAIPATMFAIFAVISIAAASLFNSDARSVTDEATQRRRLRNEVEQSGELQSDTGSCRAGCRFFR